MKTKKFSIKKLLLCILCSTIITTFVGFTILFVVEIPDWLMSEVMNATDENSELLIEAAEKTEEVVKKYNEEKKSAYGEEYPANGILVQRMVYFFRSNLITCTYVLTLLTGIVLGTMVYIVSVQGAKGKQLVIESIVAFIIIFLVILVVNFGYEALINKAIKELGVTEGTYKTYIYDIENNNIVLPYMGLFGLTYLCTLIRQKILTNKLNKELDNK